MPITVMIRFSARCALVTFDNSRENAYSIETGRLFPKIEIMDYSKRTCCPWILGHARTTSRAVATNFDVKIIRVKLIRMEALV